MKKLLKNSLILSTIIGTMFLALTSISAEKAYAAPNNDPNNNTTTNDPIKFRSGNDCYEFLGLTSWDCGLETIDSEETLKSNIWLIAANVATDITVIAAYLVLGYVIYGGYLYTFSGGDSGKVADGKKTLAQAFIGLAITMSAYVIASALRIALLGQGGAFNCNPLTNPNNCIQDANSVVTGAINWFTAIAGVASAIFLVYGGIEYMTSAGEPQKVQKAKQMIIYSLIGLAIVALSFTITAFVSNMIRESNKVSLLNEKNLKEENEIKII